MKIRQGIELLEAAETSPQFNDKVILLVYVVIIELGYEFL